ncbi:MAG TPA: phage tail length tape measure family protein [Anaerolineales bacterium]|nr:phage tail length tape measure family protein [Anaerolineales bacterium]
MAIQLGSAYGKVSIDSSGVKSGVADGIKHLEKLEGAAHLIGGAMQKIGGAMTLGVTLPVVAFFKASIDSAVEAESALAELNAVLRSTGGAAGLTADELTHMASELQKVTKFSDDEIILGESMLLTFTKIGKDVFPLATEAMLNMAEKFGGVDQAAIQLGKALNDPIAGVGALRRVGVSLTEEQENQIKSFMAVNDIASAQKIILNELEVEFGGLARAAGDTTAGKMAQLTNAFDDLKETVGAQLIPVILPLVKGLTKLVETLASLPAPVQRIIIVFLALAALAGPVILFAGSIISAIGSIAGLASSLGALGITLPALSAGIATVGTTITATLLPAIGAVIVALLPILAILAGLLLWVGIVYLAWKNNFLGMRDNINALIVRLKGIFEVFNRIREGAIKLFEDGSGALLDLAVAFGFPEKAAQAFLQTIYDIIVRFREIFARAREFIVNAFTSTDWSQLGKFIMFGIANGLLFGIPGLILAATKAVQAVLDTFDTQLDAHSPSKKLEQRGVWSGQGYIAGLMKSLQPNAISDTLAKPLGNNNTQQQNITMQFSSGLTVQQVKGMIAENNEQLVNSIIGALGGA